MGAHLQLHRRKLTLDNIDPRIIDMVDEMLSIVVTKLISDLCRTPINRDVVHCEAYNS